MTNPDPVRTRRRRWKRLLAALVIGPVVVLAALPWALSTAPARRWLLAKANRVLAPGALELGSLRFSWFGPTRMSGFVILDPEGDRVVAAPVAIWDRNLKQVLLERPRLGTLTLDRAALDVERRADGSVDLYEALKPVIGLNDKTELKVVVEHGSLRFRDAGQPVPVTAEDAALTVEIAADPLPMNWKLNLSNTRTNGPASLKISGTLGRAKAAKGPPGDLMVQVVGERWPWSIAGNGVSTSGRLDGRITVQHVAGRWASAGIAELADLDAAGPRLAGDHMRLDRVAAAWDWDPARMIGSGSKNRLRIETPVGLFRARSPVPFSPESSRMEGGIKPRGSERAGLASGERESTPSATLVEGTLDLAALARQVPHALRIREGITLDRGSATLHALVGRQAWEVEARLSDLAATGQGRSFTLRDPATLSAWLRRRDDVGLAVERFTVQTPFLNGSGQGNLKDGITWAGTLDLSGIERQLGELVDFRGVELAGKGELKGDFRRAATGSDLDAHATASLHDLRIGGFRRDEVRLDGGVVLKESASSLLAWDRIRVEVASGDARAAIKADSRAGAADLDIIAEAPTSRADHPRQARGTLAASWDGQALEIGQLALTVTGGDKPDAMMFAARGRFEREAGTLVLGPVATDRGPGTMALAPEGVHVSGIGKAGALRANVVLVGDLKALRQLGMLEGSAWDGRWSVRAEAQQTSDGLRLGGRFDLADLSRLEGLGAGTRTEGLVVASLTALYQSDADRLELAELALSSRYATLEASGSLAEPGGRRLADLKGTLKPDWEAINTWLADRVEPGAKVSGKPRAWRVRGSLAGGSASEVLKAIDGDIGFDLTEVDVHGMRVGPTPVVVHAREGRLVLDAIDTTINEGRIHLEPTISLGDDAHGPSLRLGSESRIEDARINDEVSRRVLSFVAPVLENATKVRGRVSVDLDEAVFPIGGDSRHDMKVNGEVLFQDVEFIAGPLGHELLGLIGRDDLRDLKLDQPVELKIADRKVYQHGLALPLGKLSRIELDGWVDFDRNLSLMASLPVTSAMVGNRPVLSDIVEGTAIRVPIRGTLRKPEIDRDAMKLALQDLGKTLLERGAVRGAAELLMRLTQPRDPNAPPPPTAAERRARRMERQEQRRRNRGIMP